MRILQNFSGKLPKTTKNDLISSLLIQYKFIVTQFLQILIHVRPAPNKRNYKKHSQKY